MTDIRWELVHSIVVMSSNNAMSYFLAHGKASGGIFKVDEIRTWLMVGSPRSQGGRLPKQVV